MGVVERICLTCNKKFNVGIRKDRRSKYCSNKCGYIGIGKNQIPHGNNCIHGKSFSKIYRIHQSMINRCYNPNQEAFKYYGGRGITVCDRWRYSFENFLHDMGDKPTGLSIERIDNNGNYEPNNCKWATLLSQSRNRSNTKLSVSKATEIRNLHLSGITRKQLAKNYGVDISNIGLVINMKTWV